MSHYGAELQRLVARPTAGARTWSLLGLATAADINHSVLCRYVSGQIVRPSCDVLRAITDALSKAGRRGEAAELLCRHLEDEIERAGLLPSEEVKVSASHRDTTIDAEVALALTRIRTRASRPGSWQRLVLALGVLAEDAGIETAECGITHESRPAAARRQAHK